MNELTLTELDMGIAVPKILQAFKPSIDHRGKKALKTWYCLCICGKQNVDLFMVCNAIRAYSDSGLYLGLCVNVILCIWSSDHVFPQEIITELN